MSEPLKFVPPRVPLIDPRTNCITREWYLFLQGVFIRIGGSDGASSTDLSTSLFEDAGNGEMYATLFTLDQAVNQVPPYEPIPVYDQIMAELSELRDTVSELRKDLDALKQSTFI